MSRGSDCILLFENSFSILLLNFLISLSGSTFEKSTLNSLRLILVASNYFLSFGSLARAKDKSCSILSALMLSLAFEGSFTITYLTTGGFYSSLSLIFRDDNFFLVMMEGLGFTFPFFSSFSASSALGLV